MTNPQTQINQARIVALYNMIPNLIWSVINLTPISIFCYHNMNGKLLSVFFAASLASGFLPQTFFDSIQFGRSSYAYKKIGVKFLNKFTRNGDLINGLIRKKLPGYNVISNRNFSQKKLLQQTYMFERFHFGMFSFFTLSTVLALLDYHFLWALILCITNLVYNIYPNLLQQYIRIRLTSFGNKKVQVDTGP